MIYEEDKIPITELIGKRIRKINTYYNKNMPGGNGEFTLGELHIEDWDGNRYIWTCHDIEGQGCMYVYLTDIIGDMKELQGYDIINVDMYKSDTESYYLDNIVSYDSIIYQKIIPKGIKHETVKHKCVYDRDKYMLCCIRIQTINGNIEAWTIGFAYEDAEDPEYSLYKIN